MCLSVYLSVCVSVCSLATRAWSREQVRPRGAGVCEQGNFHGWSWDIPPRLATARAGRLALGAPWGGERRTWHGETCLTPKLHEHESMSTSKWLLTQTPKESCVGGATRLWTAAIQATMTHCAPPAHCHAAAWTALCWALGPNTPTSGYPCSAPLCSFFHFLGYWRTIC
jgi:hypothetical protein